MKEFDLTEHLLKKYECDFFYYYMTNNPANNNDNIVYVNFGG